MVAAGLNASIECSIAAVLAGALTLCVLIPGVCVRSSRVEGALPPGSRRTFLQLAVGVAVVDALAVALFGAGVLGFVGCLSIVVTASLGPLFWMVWRVLRSC